MIDARICNSCKSEIQRTELDSNYSICPCCGYYMRMHARERILLLADKNSFHEWDANMKFSNPLNDIEYEKKATEASIKYELNDAIITGEMDIESSHVAIGVMDTRYMMASMGHVVGEKVTRLFERAKQRKLTVILFCCSGGARMQEGIISLMQMEKTAAAVKQHSEAGLLYISVLTNPTMGGVSASFAMIADIVLAEKGAKIGFAGSRVIQQTTGVKLPEGFQSAEFQKEHGFVDAIVSRENLKKYLSELVKMHMPRKFKISMIDKKVFLSGKTDEKISAWEKVKIARDNDRATSRDYIGAIFESFKELCGDRVGKEDPTILGGIAYFDGNPVTVIGQQKGKKNIQEMIHYNWGMPSPSGYRKALRLMKQAEKFKRPVICFIDTMGAACTEEAEKQGQSLTIANLLRECANLKVPILSIIIGEGGSGGALALAVGNEVWMLEHAVYSILTPEGYASILWKDSSRAKEAAELMKMRTEDLYKLGVIDKTILEKEPVTSVNIDSVVEQLKYEMEVFLRKYGRMTRKRIVKDRQLRFRKY